MWITVFILLIGAFTACYAWALKKMTLFKNSNVAEDPGYFPMGSSVTSKLMLQKIAFVMQYVVI